MKYIDEYRNPEIAKNLLNRIEKEALELLPVKIMEVCGTHTMSIFRSGIKNILPEKIRLISGPGCPVCVTPNRYLDKLITLSKKKNVIVTTFGDMVKVPGSFSSLEKEKSEGADIRIVYSAWDNLKICTENPDKAVVFAAVGFETTVPGTALTVKEAKKRNIENFYILSAQKLIPPAMKILSENGKLNIDGFLCPAHVSAIIGSNAYRFLAEKYNKACVVTGFEPLDVLQGVLMILLQIRNKNYEVEIQYNRVVKKEGNVRAFDSIFEVFEESNAEWRGIGIIEGSGLAVRSDYEKFDADKVFEIKMNEPIEPEGCICGLILQGVKEPTDCRLFWNICTPENPVGACMVSSEGTCAAFYKYS